MGKLDKAAEKINKIDPKNIKAKVVDIPKNIPISKKVLDAIKGLQEDIGQKPRKAHKKLKEDGGFYGHMDVNKIKRPKVIGC